jgi:hypothetical protein
MVFRAMDQTRVGIRLICRASVLYAVLQSIIIFEAQNVISELKLCLD